MAKVRTSTLELYTILRSTGISTDSVPVLRFQKISVPVPVPVPKFQSLFTRLFSVLGEKKTIRTPYFKFQINPYPNPYPYLKKLCFGTRTRNRIPYLYSVKVNADKVIRYSKWKIWNGKLEITLAALFTCLLHDRFNEFVVTMTVPVDQWKYILGVTCIYIIWKKIVVS